MKTIASKPILLSSFILAIAVTISGCASRPSVVRGEHVAPATRALGGPVPYILTTIITKPARFSECKNHQTEIKGQEEESGHSRVAHYKRGEPGAGNDPEQAQYVGQRQQDDDRRHYQSDLSHGVVSHFDVLPCTLI